LGEPKKLPNGFNVKLNNIGAAQPWQKGLEKQFQIRQLALNEANAQFETGSQYP